MLSIQGLNTHYGASHILQGVDLELPKGRIAAVLGRNGVGKTTTVKTIMGLVAPSGGRVTLDGTPITGWAPHRVARAGVAYVPEGRLIFPDLTVVENIRVAERKPAKAWPLERLLELFPSLHERQSEQGLAAIGRRAADAGDRPCAGRAIPRCCSSTSRARAWHRWSCASWRGSSVSCAMPASPSC